MEASSFDATEFFRALSHGDTRSLLIGRDRRLSVDLGNGASIAIQRSTT
jgi:hypothetical protein